ncbi:hypothetical protein L1049_017728 [Liquidambar formosana]|uniref:Fungal lipase-type domain-containing protein n=1 Tax=Liquidambar formosana TaxID=63359 RepID=A0AAP0X4K1_LIQFO
MVLPYNEYWHDTFPLKNPVPTPLLGRKLPFGRLARKEYAIRIPKKSRVSSLRDSLPMVSNLEREIMKEEDDNDGVTIAEEPTRGIADAWQEIHGQYDWAGMLDPFDPLLRSELIRYGEMAQACYDAFDFDPFSRYCGSCKFKPSNFFQCLGLSSHGYNLTRNLYATYNINLPNFFKRSLWPEGWSPTANWMGYVAVSNDETSKNIGRRDITIAWRGTVTRDDWVADFTDFLRPVTLNKIPCPDPTVKVESGFLHLYTDKDKSCRFCKYSAREQILAEVKRLIQLYANEDLSITITGHSLGSALAIINAYDMAETGVDVMEDGRVVPISVFSFSGPRVGNIRFKERLEGLGVKVLRVVNVHDKVPREGRKVYACQQKGHCTGEQGYRLFKGSLPGSTTLVAMSEQRAG